MPMFNPNKSWVQEQLNCMSAWVWSIMLCLTDVANTGHWSGRCWTQRDLHADWGWEDEHTLQRRSPHSSQGRRTQTVLHRTNTCHKWACIHWTGMLGHAAIISRVLRYYFKRAVCVCVPWKNAKHAKARGAQHSLTQLLKRNCCLLELLEAVYNTLTPVLNINMREVTVSTYQDNILVASPQDDIYDVETPLSPWY